MHTVYRLTIVDYHKYCQHLKLLDEDSKYLRFGYPIKNEVIDIVFDRIYKNPLKHKIFVIENDNLEVVAAGHVSLETDPVELAFSVLKDYQGQGMGSALMKRCIEWCQNRNIETGCMVCLARNAAIRRLASKHGILVNQDGEVQAELTIPKANAVSVFNEIADDGIAVLDHVGKSQRRFAQFFRYPLNFK
jgi:GNAT superfamily N-acetyltransferase